MKILKRFERRLTKPTWCTGSTIVLASLYLPFANVAQAADTSRVSELANGTQGNQASFYSAMSEDGRYIAFATFASSLIPGKSTTGSDIAVVDRKTGVLERISQSSKGSQANDFSDQPTISANGRYVVFESSASNLVSNDTNSRKDVFLHDRNTRQTSRISVSSTGTQGNGNSDAAMISADGSAVVFQSTSNNLAAGDTNNAQDIFVHYISSGVTQRVSYHADGNQSQLASYRPVINGNGSVIAFLTAGSLEKKDTNGKFDFYIRKNNTTSLATLGNNSEIPNASSYSASLSENGRYLAFDSDASNLVSNDSNRTTDVFIRDLTSHTTQRVSLSSSGTQANGASASPNISGDGQSVTFLSIASNLVNGDSNGYQDTFLRELSSRKTDMISVNSASEAANDNNFRASTGETGRYVVFEGQASNLVENDTNNLVDVFIRDRGTECDVTQAINKFTLKNLTFELLSLPCEPPAGTTIEALFGDDIAGSYGSPNWAVYTLDSSSSTPKYVDMGANGTLQMGQGFWIFQGSGSSVTLDLPAGSRGIASHYSEQTACTGNQGCVSVELSDATHSEQSVLWNLLGNPLNDQNGYSASALRVVTESGSCRQSSGGCSLNEAVSPRADVLTNVLYRFNSSSGNYIALNESSSLKPWEGYWVGSLDGAVANSPKLLFPDFR